MIKPYLIASNHDNKRKILIYIFNLVYEILMFLSTTTLAYLSFNKNYQFLHKLNFLKNCKYFSYLYIFNYIVTIISTYSILLFVVCFEFQAYRDNCHVGKYFKWYAVIYPQCGWLSFIKLYFNEISRTIDMIKQYNKQYNEKNLIRFMSNVNIYQKVEYATTRLFLFQILVIICAFASFYIYLLEIVHQEFVYQKNNQWNVIWYWQLFLSVMIWFSMPFATYFALNKKYHCVRGHRQINDAKGSFLVDQR